MWVWRHDLLKPVQYQTTSLLQKYPKRYSEKKQHNLPFPSLAMLPETKHFFTYQMWNFSSGVTIALCNPGNICHILKTLNKEKVKWVSYLQHKVNLLGMAALRCLDTLERWILNADCWRLNANTGTGKCLRWTPAVLKKTITWFQKCY